MFFAVTHIDAGGHRRKARVLARDWSDAIGQMEQEFGVGRRVSCLRMQTRPVLCIARQQGRLVMGRAA
jgi:hypothetical protein